MSNVPRLRFPEFGGEWGEKNLSNIGKIITGSTPSTSVFEYYNGDKLFISPADIQQNRYISNTKTTLTELGFSKGRKVSKNSVCFVCIGSTIGKVAQLCEESLTNQQINCITSNKDNCNDFIYSLLEFKASRIKLLAGEQAVPQINKSDFSKLKFYFPSKQEQQKIASFLTSVDKKIEQLTKKEALLQEYKKGVMQKIFSQELRFKADDGSEFSAWEEKKLGDVGDIITGKTPSTSDESLWDGNIQFVTPTDISDEKYQYKTLRTVTNHSKLKILPAGSIMFTCIASIGKMSLSTQPCITNQQINSIVPNNKHNNEYIYYAVLSISDFIKSTQANTTLPIINKTEFSKFEILVPDIDEQTKIANFLSSIDTKIEQVQKQLEQSKEFKKALLQQMFV